MLRAMTAAPGSVSFREAVRVWARIGLLSFGGPAGQVALMHRELVEKRRWIDEPRFLHALNYCMLLPGPEAQQLATYIGWLMHGTKGGLVSGALFVLPGFVAILALSMLYAGFRELPAVSAVFFGLKAAVLAVVVEAVLRIGRRALKGRVFYALAALAFVAIFFFEAPFPLIVLGAGVLGLVGSRVAPDVFPRPADVKAGAHAETVIDQLARDGRLAHTAPSRARALRVTLVSLALWFVPLALLAAVFGPSSVFVDLGVFFSQAAVVTFGGAYAVLAFIAQQAVEVYGWLEPGEMLDGLGLAETTPGPLIMVVQFVAFLGAFRHPEGLSPMLAGVLGSVVTVWVTFVPCFFWIFLGAPYIEALRGDRRLHAALSAITASIVGVILNLSIWFAVHVVFAEVREHHVGPLRLLAPVWATIDVAAAVLAAGAMVALLRLHVSVPKTLAACALLGAAWRVWG
ncbi:chromate efflux transporter [Myxococcota bacterium]|nr:chromate efflux transporter [Myxococcota bacterium]